MARGVPVPTGFLCVTPLYHNEVTQTLKAELGDDFNDQLNARELRQNCHNKLKYLFREEMNIPDELHQSDENDKTETPLSSRHHPRQA